MMPTFRSIQLLAAFVLVTALTLTVPARAGEAGPAYKVLAPVTQGNLTLFPVIADSVHDTSNLMTLDEGLRSGRVVVTESGGSGRLVRPPIWHERPPFPPQNGARVNQLALINNSGRPLLLLAGEIVTGGKQDRVVGKDRIIAPDSNPVPLDVFCVEPHRWVETSANFSASNAAMAQPSVRLQAMSAKSQQSVWNEVAKSRMAAAQAAPLAAQAINGSSSYAAAMQNGYVRKEIDAMTAPLEQSYEKLITGLRARKAVGAVIAIDGQLVWVDVFASPDLLDKYWPKLIRSYAAEALATRWHRSIAVPPSLAGAQRFLDTLDSRHENVESEPGLFRNTEIRGDDFDAFILTSLLPGANFTVHIAKMRH